MSSIEIRHLALDYAVKTAQSGEVTSNIVNAAKAFEAYLTGTETAEAAPSSPSEECEACGARHAGHTISTHLDEPAVGAVVVLRSPSTGALIPVLCQPRGAQKWFDLIEATFSDWADLIEGREIIAVHTPDGAA
jgi:hypothetical protein